MRYVKLHSEYFPEFFNRLKEVGRVYGPVRHNSTYRFEEVNSIDELSLDYTRTILPPKKFFIRPRDAMFKIQKNEVTEVDGDGKFVLFGVHSCDIHGIKILDKVYLSNPPDPYYERRRKNAFIVGISCMPDEYCFCKSLGTDFAMDGFDIFLHELPDGWLVRVGSVKGHEFVWENQDIFDDVTEEDLRNFKEFEEKRAKAFKKSLNKEGLADILDLAFTSKVWKKYAEKCLGCGNCTIVCPTCRCYEVCDTWVRAYEALRMRRYDSCFMPTHGLVAGGHNFRPTRLDRFRHRYYCKNYFDPEAGFNCVGCGRCDEFCPARIEHVKVLDEVREGLI
ncbi:hydrogenase [Pyrococcus furiosus DSM 3638]|uniref:Sulfhydrogenase 2 subunit beta n=3 Tax=Pyrococcus furiosus TaxID=2261 RepID=HYD2B_PYRFU|nr:NAD(P)-dependent hydrogenase/sulfhydrogenase 2 subunit beta [Pyrococcus furiosus]E7FHN9.1 RecName: Full=Sulfhydrogenase 2 subunit beta; AltName: Full=Hydrogenase-II subunit beta; Short=H-II beta; AltName: Full=Sulfhydrogenase II subunit beta; AltName: Full=Sulfur reductase subunit ShyB [Pyrococcus furiosus DSM 3638]AAF61851.1 sulfhydrogenase II subunit b [Pyrococcus furiosus DSM 3638]AAL81453.1 H-II hydrogenase subunit beta [Pyrococcus furiosus DSM 3638]AFN04109.1 hydrogenase subunit beta [P